MIDRSSRIAPRSARTRIGGFIHGFRIQEFQRRRSTTCTPRTSTLKGGRKQMIYFFAREMKAGALDAVPAGLPGRRDDQDRHAHPEEEVSLRLPGQAAGPAPRPAAERGGRLAFFCPL